MINYYAQWNMTSSLEIRNGPDAATTAKLEIGDYVLFFTLFVSNWKSFPILDIYGETFTDFAIPLLGPLNFDRPVLDRSIRIILLWIILPKPFLTFSKWTAAANSYSVALFIVYWYSNSTLHLKKIDPILTHSCPSFSVDLFPVEGHLLQDPALLTVTAPSAQTPTTTSPCVQLLECFIIAHPCVLLLWQRTTWDFSLSRSFRPRRPIRVLCFTSLWVFISTDSFHNRLFLWFGKRRIADIGSATFDVQMMWKIWVLPMRVI